MKQIDCEPLVPLVMHHRYAIRGDVHGNARELVRWCEANKDYSALIILGDFGMNYYLDGSENRKKKWLQETDMLFYVVRGNHEERPENVPGMELWYDAAVSNFIYVEPKYPNIRYLVDGYIYKFNDYHALVLGGAYSVDKWWRLRAGGDAKWFASEQLTDEEKALIQEECAGEWVDFVFSHTCPYSVMPRDLFLNSVDQQTVDNSMEFWLEELSKQIRFTVWLFGHFHQDRVEAPYYEMFFKEAVNLDEILDRWDTFSLSGELPWYIPVSPSMERLLKANKNTV